MGRRKYKRSTKIPGTRLSTPLYSAWNNMKYRCYSRSNKRYKNYGGRGIVVCDQWHDFDNFADDIEAGIGLPRKGWTLDRINNNGNYEPSNVQWSTNAANCQHSIRTKITKVEAAQMRLQYATGKYLHRELATMYGITRSNVSAILRNERWV